MLFHAQTSHILNESSNFDVLKKSAEEIRNILEEMTGIDGNDLNAEKDTKLNTGVAITPENAVACITDFMRTVKFMRGVYNAVLDMQKKFPSEKIHLLYVGTGPFASLVIPLLHLFDPQKLKITYLDIYKRSTDTLEEIIHELNLKDFTNGIICCDAVTYKHPQPDKVHIVLSETMSSGLKKEMQVPITLNLVPQICNGGALVPENIVVSVSADKINTTLNGNSCEISKNIFSKKIFELNIDSIINFVKYFNGEKDFTNKLLPAEKVVIPENFNFPLKLKIDTEIKVCKNIIIGYNETSLTLPYNIKSNKNFSGGNVLKFYYKINEYPEFVFDYKRKQNLFNKLFTKIFS